MKSYIQCLVATFLLGAAVVWGQAGDAPPNPPKSEDGVEVLTRGPIHEAFAESVTFNPEPGIVAPKSPPAPIEELPPEQKPQGANVAWIPGYWAWDDERSDFLWVSGVWRALPPGRQWVSGYWGKSGKGAQWTSGYWADAKASEVEYLPEPPDTVEAGPNIAAPSADHIWVPGSWMWNQRRYAWRPGYWATAQADWVWTPSYYVWAPRGYVFVDGYWDYSVARRGVLFAPVYFSSGVYSRRDYRYSPATVISLSVFSDHLFSRPAYQHYYFGDYYGANYQTAGYYASYSVQSRRYGYDPIYAHQRWQHRQDGEWDRRVEAQFQHRRDHEDARPPRTWTAQRALSERPARTKESGLLVATPLDQLSRSPDSPIRLQPVDKQERQRYAERGQQMRKFGDERQRLEDRAADAPAERAAPNAEPRRVKFSKSPIVATSAAELAKGQAPPQAFRAPAVDPKVEPKPRRPVASVEPPKVEARPVRPKVEAKPELPQTKPTPERPKAEPRPERPKTEPKPERPKPEARPERPKTQPTPERPKAEPRPERPKSEAPVKKPEPSKPESPKREPPKAPPKERPPREAKEAPKREPQEKPKREAPEKPERESKEKPNK